MGEGLRRKLWFLFSGSTGFAIYFVLSLLLVRLPQVGAGTAAFVATLLAVPPTYLMQKRLTFRHRGGGLRSFVGYCVLQLFNAVAVGLLARAGQHLGLEDALNFILSGAVVVVVSYLVMSRILFRAAREP